MIRTWRQAAINKGEEQNGSAQIKLEALAAEKNSLIVNHTTEGKMNPGEQLVLLLVQKMATSEIKKGENRGKTLHHINIVRNIQQVKADKQSLPVSFELPAGLEKKDFFIAAFMQDNQSGKILAMQTAEIN